MSTVLPHIVRTAYQRLPEPWRARVTELRRPGRRVLVSVVVPVYNVERYVGECLESILSQTHRRLEVIVVDDGSPDRSIDVVRDIAARDRRVRIVQQENAGLGAARNTGVRHARGEMLWFVDSDDTVPATAVEAMLTSLHASGSDFAVGSLLRQTKAGLHMPPWARDLHSRTRSGVTIADEPEVLKNVFAWTKLFRTEFFRRVVGGFPDGLYEDQVPSAKAYLHGRFDVLDDVVCHWRIREDESSITQQKATMRDLTGRWAMLDELHEVMRDAPQPVRQAWEAKVIGFDMRPYYEQVPRTGDEYWTFLQREVRGFLDRAGYERLREVPVPDRLLAAATYHHLREDVIELIARRESRTWKVHGVVRDGEPVLGPDYFDGLSLASDGVVERLDGDVDVVSYVKQVVIDERSATIEGSAYLGLIDLAGGDSEIRVDAVPTQGRRVPGRIERFEEPEVDVRAGDPWNDHAKSGFTATFDLDDLVEPPYRFEVTVAVEGVVRVGELSQPDPRGSGRLPAFGPLEDAGRWYVEKADALELRRLLTPRVAVSSVRVSDQEVEVEVAGVLPQARAYVARSGRSTVRGTVRRPDDGSLRVAFSLPPSPQPDHSTTWTLGLMPARGGRDLRFSWADASGTVELPSGSRLLVGSTKFGNVVVHRGPVVGEITSTELTAEGLRVQGWARALDDLVDGMMLALRSDAAQGTSVPLALGPQGGFDVTLPVVDRVGNALSKSSAYFLTLESGPVSVRPRAASSLVSSLPVQASNGTISATFAATSKAGAVSVRLRSAVDHALRSRRAQHRLQMRFATVDHEALDAVLFESFGGQSVGDSPLALSRELYRRSAAIPQFWSVDCLSTPVPEWATPVLRFTEQWYELLARARVLVNNNNWPWFFRKRAYQTYLQTWHGTPLKRIGNDVPGSNLSITYRRLMNREVASWDYLLAQNEYSAEILPRAFGYGGPVLVEGYPRNDSLVDDSAELTRKAIRARLGIDEDVRVLLYAPTWRDNIKDGAHYGRVAFLDFEMLVAGTGPRTVVLYRGHSNTSASSSELPEGVIDVTHHPDVNELMLASDALVTDYSSIMFDYGVLRRPIYLLVPDLELYRSKTRGFYRELEDVAPGPLCADTAELMAALATDYWSAWGDAHGRFVAEFAPLDDGAAAGRVLDATGLSD